MIFASEVSVITGLNPFQSIDEIFNKIWRRTDPAQVFKLENEMKYDEIILPKETIVKQIIKDNKEIDKVVKETVKLSNVATNGNEIKKISNVFAKKLKIINDVQSIKISKNILKQAPDIKVEEDIVKHVSSEINKKYGIKYEDSAIMLMEDKQQIKVQEKNTEFFKRKIGKIDNRLVYLGGRIDGRLVNGRVIEVKNRISRIYNPIPKYDIAQLLSYLFILNSKEGEMIQQLKDKKDRQKSTIIPWDSKMWDHDIYPRISYFSHSLSQFIEEEKSQVRFLKANEIGKKNIIKKYWMESPKIMEL